MPNPRIPDYDHRPQRYQGPSIEAVLAWRREFLSPALMTYYQSPLMIVQGSRQYVYDEKGRRYLDAFGGIVSISVGHCHPAVLQKAREQMDLLQHATTIYLHPVITEYARELAAKMPGALKVCYFVNSGSEANDLALLLARLHTGHYDVIALRNAYHGGVASTLGLTAHSTWKFDVPHSFGVHHALNPDPYRGPWPREDPEAGAKYAADVQDLIDSATPGRVAAFFAESIQGVGGAVVYPDGYLSRVYEMVRRAGGVCIADEVQTGFGRTGHHYWGFENQGVIPDIVTLAKGIGNGAPLAAVVTTPEIAATLTRRHHFNTFGGNPVSCAMGRAVLEVIDRERLQQNALELGQALHEGLEQLRARHSLVGDVRGLGLMIGVELVKDRGTKEPAPAECDRVLERARELGLLIGRGGLRGNVLRIKPPLCITRADVAFALEVLEEALEEADLPLANNN